MFVQALESNIHEGEHLHARCLGCEEGVFFQLLPPLSAIEQCGQIGQWEGLGLEQCYIIVGIIVFMSMYMYMFGWSCRVSAVYVSLYVCIGLKQQYVVKFS